MSTPFTCVRNSDFSFLLSITQPEGILAGVHVRSQIRKYSGSLVLATMDSQFNDGSVILDVLNNRIQLFVPAKITTTFPLGILQFDIFIYNLSGTIQRNIFPGGQIEVFPAITEFKIGKLSTFVLGSGSISASIS